MGPDEQEFKRIADWLVMQAKIEGHVPPQHNRAYKRPTAQEFEKAKKQAVVAALIATRRGNDGR